MQRYKRALAICRSLKQGAGVHQSCKAANTSVSAFYNWRRENPKFDKFVENIYDSRTANVVDALYKNAMEGNTTAQIFWLKNKARWKDVYEQVGGGTNVFVAPNKTLIFKDIKNADARTDSIHVPESTECHRP